MSDTEEAVAAEPEVVEYDEDVHSLNPDIKFMANPKNNAPGFGYFETNCGKRVNEAGLVITDDPDAVTCAGCKGA